MKILQIRSEFRDNGPGTQALTLGKELRSRGHEITFAASGGLLVPSIKDAGFDFCEIETLAVTRRSPLDSLKTISKLKKLIGENKFDVIHAHNAASIVLAAIASKLARNPATYVQSVRGIELRKNYQWRNWIYRINPAQLLAVSDFTRRELIAIGVQPKKVTVTYNGVDVDRFNPDRIDSTDVCKEFSLDGGPVIGQVGNFSGDKGQHVVVQALPHIRKRHPNVRVVFVGEGPAFVEVRELAQKLGVTDLIRFPGFSLKIPEFQSAFDLYVQPSTWGEMFPNAILEAMAMGNPWVGSDISGLSELTDNGQAGIVLEPGNVEAFANTVSDLLDDKNKLKQMGEHAYEFVHANFTIKKVVDTIERVYRRDPES